MLKMEQNLVQEKNKLNELVAGNNFDLLNDIILEQSRKVDKILVTYQKLRFLSIKRQLARLSKAE